MDLFNRPPTISEDTLQYILYPNEQESDRASVTTLAVLMQTYANTLLPDMQWHRDSFQLKVASHPSRKGFLLEGTMRVGDSIDDEWCAVWLLREISAKWDVAIRCVKRYHVLSGCSSNSYNQGFRRGWRVPVDRSCRRPSLLDRAK